METKYRQQASRGPLPHWGFFHEALNMDLLKSGCIQAVDAKYAKNNRQIRQPLPKIQFQAISQKLTNLES